MLKTRLLPNKVFPAKDHTDGVPDRGSGSCCRRLHIRPGSPARLPDPGQAWLSGRSFLWLHRVPPFRGQAPCCRLKGIQKEHSKLEAEFQEEVLQLEKKYFLKFTPLYQKRTAIVNGATEPTEDEVQAGEEDEEEEEEGEGAAVKEESAAESAEKVNGIPEFWLSAMKNQISLAEMITDRDEEALRSLTDIRMEYLDKPGFRLIFEFADNEFFTNKIITKTYFYQNESGYGGDFIYDHAEGSNIDWKAGKDLTVRVEQKKQRNKSRCCEFIDAQLPLTRARH